MELIVFDIDFIDILILQMCFFPPFLSKKHPKPTLRSLLYGLWTSSVLQQLMYGYQPGNLKGRMGHELVFGKDQRFSKSEENFTDLVFLKICYYHYLLLRVYWLYSFPSE